MWLCAGSVAATASNVRGGDVQANAHCGCSWTGTATGTVNAVYVNGKVDGELASTFTAGTATTTP
jgi:hypothetical protein